MATSRKLFENPEEKVVKRDLFVKVAKNLAERFATEGNMKFTQVRKFYSDIMGHYYRLKNGISTFRKEHPYILMVIPKAEYAKARNTINNSFLEFIKEYLNDIRDQDDFYVFVDLFEAVVAFSRTMLKN